MARKPTDEVQLKLRFSEALRRRLERVAARNNRSMNTEIIHRLEESLARDPTIENLLRELNDRLAQLGMTESFGQRLTAINEKLDKLIALQRLSALRS
jgi:hypothetical protein